MTVIAGERNGLLFRTPDDGKMAQKTSGPWTLAGHVCVASMIKLAFSREGWTKASVWGT
jgi:hypothetical protein